MQEKIDRKGDWVTYRPDIQVLDCTIRDGGLMNSHKFEDEVVRGVYEACIAAGVHTIELGYKNTERLFSPKEHGDWRFCREEDLRRIVGDNDSDLKISVMADAEKCDLEKDLLQRQDSVIDMVRVATYIHQVPLAIDMLADAHEKGYETCINLMAVSTVQERELDQALAALMETEVQTLYLVDSFGSMYSEQIQALTRKYLSYARPAGKNVGIHAHNNLQLAFANTIESLILGTSHLDATMAGLGRGAGNCPMELLLGFLHNPRFRQRPVIECLERYIHPLRESVRWGYELPYMMTGFLNQHPRAAMRQVESGQGDHVIAFYDELHSED